ncbi:MAG: T9SS type A sorting domain-containing protein, partial [Saprospiraceae bacterium]
FINNLIPLGIEDDVIEPQVGSTANGSISLRVVGSVGGLTYTWSGPNGFTSDTEDISNLESGEYTLVVMDGNGCTTSYTGIVGSATNTTSISKGNGGSISPNPANDRIQMEWMEGAPTLDNINRSVEVFDVHGRSMPLTGLTKVSDQKIALTIGAWQSGIYFVRMRLKEGVVQSSFVKL